MTSWGGMVRRSGGEEVRKEDETRSFLKIHSIGPAKQFGYWGGHTVNPEIKEKVRCHKIHFFLENEADPEQCLYWKINFVYELGGKGKEQFLKIVDEVIKENGKFEGLEEDKKGDLHTTEKTQAIIQALFDKVKLHNREILGIPFEKRYNLQEILSGLGVTKEMWEHRENLPWLIQWYRISGYTYHKLERNDDYEAFFMGLSNDAELWYEEADNKYYAYFQSEDMNLECNKWDDLVDLDEYVEVRITDKDEHPLKDSEGNWIKQCSPGDMQIHLIVDYGAGDSILKELVEYMESDED